MDYCDTDEIGSYLIKMVRLYRNTRRDAYGTNFIVELLEVLHNCFPCGDRSLRIFLRAARNDLFNLLVLARDSREHPELLQFVDKDVSSVIRSFIVPDDGFVADGIDFVFAVFIGPTSKWLWNWHARVDGVSMMTFLSVGGYFEREPLRSIITIDLVEEHGDELMVDADSDSEMEDVNMVL